MSATSSRETRARGDLLPQERHDIGRNALGLLDEGPVTGALEVLDAHRGKRLALAFGLLARDVGVGGAEHDERGKVSLAEPLGQGLQRVRLGSAVELEDRPPGSEGAKLVVEAVELVAGQAR